jgi:hydrogenase expression/formation protein HypC
MCLGVPGRVVETYRDEHDVAMARVDFGGVRRPVCVEHVPDAAAGDYVLVHVGFALSRIDADEAGRIFALLKELDQLETGEEGGEP